MDPDEFMDKVVNELYKKIEQGLLPEPSFGVMEPYMDLTENEGELVCGLEVKVGFPSTSEALNLTGFGPTQVLTIGIDKLFMPNDDFDLYFPFYSSKDIDEIAAPVKKDFEGYIQLTPGPYVRTNFTEVTEVNDLPPIGYSIRVGQSIEDCIKELLQVMTLRAPRPQQHQLN